MLNTFHRILFILSSIALPSSSEAMLHRKVSSGFPVQRIKKCALNFIGADDGEAVDWKSYLFPVFSLCELIGEMGNGGFR